MELMWIVVVALAVAATWRMRALTANADVDRFIDQELRTYPVGAAEHVYRDALVGIDPAGYLKAFVPGDLFVGIAYAEADNSSGSAGDLNCKVWVVTDFEFTLTGVALTDAGKPVYATADDAIALTGHPDAFVGRVVHYLAANTALVRLKAFGEQPPNGEGSFELRETGAGTFEGLTTTTGQKYLPSEFTIKSIDGAGVHQIDGEDGGIEFSFDAQAEVALASLRAVNATFPVDKGITLEAEVTVHDNGDAAAVDLDIGLGTALTTNSEADIDHADMVQLAAFHFDSNDEHIDCQSDDNTTDVAAVDSTIDNVADTYKTLKIIVRPTGAVEFWIDGARVLSSTTFAVLSTAVVAPFVNVEKTSDDTVYSLYLRHLRVAGGKV